MGALSLLADAAEKKDEAIDCAFGTLAVASMPSLGKIANHLPPRAGASCCRLPDCAAIVLFLLVRRRMLACRRTAAVHQRPCDNMH